MGREVEVRGWRAEVRRPGFVSVVATEAFLIDDDNVGGMALEGVGVLRPTRRGGGGDGQKRGDW